MADGSDGSGAVAVMTILFISVIILAIATNEESIEEKLDRAVKITEEIDGEYCIKYSTINKQVILDEEYCLPLKNKKTIENYHKSVLERQAVLDNIKNDHILSRLVNFTEPMDKIQNRGK